MKSKRTLVAGVVAAVVALVLIASVTDFGGQAPSTSTPRQGQERTELRGRLAWTARDGLWSMDLPDGAPRRIVETSVAVGSGVTSVTFSPDGTRLAWSRQAVNGGATGADIWTANADGSNAEIFAQRDAPTTMLEAPIWLSSGDIYYTVRRFPGGRERVSLERKRSSGPAEIVVEGLHMVSLAPDGSTLVSVQRPPLGAPVILRTRMSASDDGCVLATEEAVPGVEQPRVSPDGAHVAFSSNAPIGGGARACSTSANASPLAAAARWFGLAPSVALAHGAPADIWIVSMNGGSFQRVAAVQDDEPTLAWSPEGARIAVLGPKGLHVATVDGGSLKTLIPKADYGWVAWGR